MYGHEVSAFLREYLPSTLNNAFRTRKRSLGDSTAHKIIQETFLAVNSKLCHDSNIETAFSGSTCVSVIFTPQKLVCANVGDSRAVLGRLVNGGK